MGNSPSSACAAEKKSNEEEYTDEGQLSEAECSEKEKKLIKSLNEIELSLKEDGSEANALLQYSKIMQIKHDINGGLSGISDIVTGAKKQWNSMDESLNEIKKHASKEVDIDALKGLKIEYFSLLLRTGVALASLIEESEIQQDNLQKLIELTNIQLASDDLTFTKKKDEIMYNACIQTLTEFTNEDKLQNILAEWKKLCQALQKQQGIFSGLYKKFKKQSSYKQIAMGIGALVVIGGVTALIIGLSAGTATPVAAVLVSDFGKVAAGWIIAGSVGLAVGAACVGGALVYGRYYIPTNDTLSKMEKIVTMIESMLKMGKKLQYEITNGMIKKQIKASGRLKNAKKNISTRVLAFKNIATYLLEYSKEGRKIVDIIDIEVNKILR